MDVLLSTTTTTSTASSSMTASEESDENNNENFEIPMEDEDRLLQAEIPPPIVAQKPTKRPMLYSENRYPLGCFPDSGIITDLFF